MKTLITKMILILLILPTLVLAEAKMTEAERLNNIKDRSEAFNKNVQNSIEKFYGAVASIDLGELAAQLNNIDSLTQKLENATGSVNSAIDRVNSSGGQYNTTQSSIQSEIAAKNKKLNDDVASTTTALAAAQAEVDKYAGCNEQYTYQGMSSYECRTKKREANAAYNTAQQKFNAAKAARKAYDRRAQGADMDNVQGSMESAGATIKETDNQVAAASAAGDESYQAQEILTSYMNNKANVAMALAIEAKQAALGLISGTVTNDFKVSETALLSNSEEGSLLQRIENEDGAMSYINLIATAAAATEYFKCTKDPATDTDCLSYPLVVAASAIYMAMLIEENKNTNSNNDDILAMKDIESDDEQYESLLRAAKLKEESLRTAMVRQEAQVIYRDMLETVNNIAMFEDMAKQQRIGTAQAQVAKAKANLKKMQTSQMITTAIQVMQEVISYFHYGTASVFWGCCNPWTSFCCINAAVQTEQGVAWKAMSVVTAGVAAYYFVQVIKAKKALKKAKRELELAKVHTHLVCERITGDGMMGVAEGVTFNFLQKKIEMALYVAKTFKNAFIPYALAEGDTAAIGLNDKTGIFKYYEQVKSEATDGLVADFPIPETRFQRTTILLENAMASVGDLDHSMDNGLANQHEQFLHILNGMNNSAGENQAGQEGGITPEIEYAGIFIDGGNGTQIRPGAGNYGALSAFKSNIGSNKATTDNAVSDSTASGSLENATLSNRGAGYLLKNNLDNNKKFGKTSSKYKPSNSGKGLYATNAKKALDSFAKANPKQKAFVASAVSSLNKSSANSPSSSANSSDSKSGDDANLNGSELGAGNSLAKNGNGSGGYKANDFKPQDVNFPINFDSDQFSDSGAGGANRGSTCSDTQLSCPMSEQDIIDGQQAVNNLQANLNKYETHNNSNEKGVYSGNNSIFTVISKRYIKSALPRFFEKKQ